MTDGGDRSTGLATPELYKSSPVCPFLLRPTTSHVAEIAAEIETGFGDRAVCGGDGNDAGDLGRALQVGLAEGGLHGHGMLVVQGV